MRGRDAVDGTQFDAQPNWIYDPKSAQTYRQCSEMSRFINDIRYQCFGRRENVYTPQEGVYDAELLERSEVGSNVSRMFGNVSIYPHEID